MLPIVLDSTNLFTSFALALLQEDNVPILNQTTALHENTQPTRSFHRGTKVFDKKIWGSSRKCVEAGSSLTTRQHNLATQPLNTYVEERTFLLRYFVT